MILGVGYFGYAVSRDGRKPTVEEPQWEEYITARGCQKLVQAEGFWDSLVMGDDWPEPNDLWTIERRGKDESRFVLWRTYYKLVITGETTIEAPRIKGTYVPLGPWELWKRDDGSYVFVEK
jgi:hypothetical protein